MDLLEEKLETNPEQLVGKDEEIKLLLEKLKVARQDGTLEELEQALTELDALQHEIATELYSKVEPEVPSDSSQDVIDANFQESSEN